MAGEKGYDIERHDEGDRPEAVPPEPESIKALDNCPNCGAPMPSIDALVCLRCGFNTKTLKVEKTAVGAAAARRPSKKGAEGEGEDEEEAEEGQEAEPVEPISRPGRGQLIVPGIAAGVGAVLLAAGYLSGAGGLFALADEPTFTDRLSGLGSGMVLVLLWAAAGLGGLYFLARVVHLAPLGDLQLASVRLLGIAFLTRLPALVVNVGNPFLEWTTESAVGAAIAVLSSMYLFSLDVRDAVLACLGSIAIFIVLVFVSAAVMWAI